MKRIYYIIKSWFGNARFYFIVVVVFICFSFVSFTWKTGETVSIKYPIDPSVWGQFGDFVGGTLGIILSLISVMLVVWTFKTQNRTAETQRFNDLFFELIRVFQSQEKELQFEYINEEGDSVASDNKDFF